MYVQRTFFNPNRTIRIKIRSDKNRSSDQEKTLNKTSNQTSKNQKSKQKLKNKNLVLYQMKLLVIVAKIVQNLSKKITKSKNSKKKKQKFPVRFSSSYLLNYFFKLFVLKLNYHLELPSKSFRKYLLKSCIYPHNVTKNLL